MHISNSFEFLSTKMVKSGKSFVKIGSRLFLFILLKFPTSPSTYLILPNVPSPHSLRPPFIQDPRVSNRGVIESTKEPKVISLPLQSS